jgi:hypothetical protein
MRRLVRNRRADAITGCSLFSRPARGRTAVPTSDWSPHRDGDRRDPDKGQKGNTTMKTKKPDPSTEGPGVEPLNVLGEGGPLTAE